jgi:hypothetical protein
MLLDFELLSLHFTLTFHETNLQQYISITEHTLLQRDYDELRLRETLANHKTYVLSV